jgi:hypothetical protein
MHRHRVLIDWALHTCKGPPEVPLHKAPLHAVRAVIILRQSRRLWVAGPSKGPDRNR